MCTVVANIFSEHTVVMVLCVLRCQRIQSANYFIRPPPGYTLVCSRLYVDSVERFLLAAFGHISAEYRLGHANTVAACTAYMHLYTAQRFRVCVGPHRLQSASEHFVHIFAHDNLTSEQS